MATSRDNEQGLVAVGVGTRRVMEWVQHNYLAILATVYPSGGPQAFPIWYDYDGVTFNFTTSSSAAKVRNIAKNPQVALCITDTTRPVRSLTVRGRAEVIRDNAAAQGLHRQLSIRYLGQEEGEEWADSMSDDDLAIVSITPEHFIWTG